MMVEWDRSSVFPDTWYYGYQSPGNLQLVNGAWIWTMYKYGNRQFDFGPDLETAKNCATALVELEG